MSKVSKLLLTLILAGVMLVAGATSAMAFDDVDLMAAWSNGDNGGSTLVQ